MVAQASEALSREVEFPIAFLHDFRETMMSATRQVFPGARPNFDSYRGPIVNGRALFGRVQSPQGLTGVEEGGLIFQASTTFWPASDRDTPLVG